MLKGKVAFDNPPINEIVIATYFNPPLVDFRSQHIGLFWKRIRNEFPLVRQQVPVGLGPDIGPDEPFPMPRFWFVAHDDINLVQIQKNAFILNWRRREQNQYPGFQNVKATFDRLFGAFEDFLRLEVDTPQIVIDLCELTYVDVIGQSQYWSKPEDTCNVIPSFSILRADPDVTCRDFDCRYVVQYGEDITLSSRFWTIKPRQSSLPALGLEMKATNQFAGVAKTRTDDWFKRAHDTIVKQFIYMTSEEVQREHWLLRSEDGE